MGALLNKSSAKKDTGDAQQQAAAAGPSDEPKPETAETAGNKEDAGTKEVEPAKPGSGDTAEQPAKTEPPANVPEVQVSEPEVQVSEPSPSNDSVTQPDERAQESATGTETKEPEHHGTEEQNPAGNEPETVDEKRDQQQEMEPAEAANDQAPEDEAKTSQDNVEPEPAANLENEVPDATHTSDPHDVSATAEDTSAVTTANGPIDEIQKDVDEMTLKDKTGEDSEAVDLPAADAVAAVVEG